MRLQPRQLLIGLAIAGLTGAVLFLPAIAFIGGLLLPSPPVPPTQHVSPLLADAIWARANGGLATELQPLNLFTVGRTASCHLLAETYEPAERQAQHDECMKLLPALEGIGYLSTVHMKSEGIWQDARVPFVQIATMHRITGTWTKAELLDTLAARGEFGAGFIGAEAASIGYFGHPADQLTLPQAAMIGALIGDGRVDPWCDTAAAARSRRRILGRMRDNLAIDSAAMESANLTEITLAPAPATHQPCKG